VKISLINTGYAAPITNRPVQLILGGTSQNVVVTVTTDTRTWAPGQTITLSATFTAPSQAGNYRLYVNMPDPAATLGTQMPLINGDSTNSAYAIRLANEGAWDARTGWNNLSTVLKVANA
jgi:hypothetical protein